MPTRYAISEPSYKYKKEVEQKTLQFLSHKLKFDLSGGDSDINLDMTLEEAEFLSLASDDVKAKAQSGELLALTTWMRDFHEKKQIILTTVYDKLDRILQQCDNMENEIVEDLQEEDEEFLKLRTSHSTNLINDLSGIQEGGRSFDNLIIVEGYVAKNPKGSDDIANKAETLRQLMTVRGAALQVKAEIQSNLVEKGTETDLSRSDFLETLNDATACSQAGSDECSGEALTLSSQIAKVRDGEMNELFALLQEHDGKSAQMNDTFANFCDYSKEQEAGQLQINDNFRVQLL